MVTTNTPACSRRLPQIMLHQVSRALILLLLLNVATFATQICAIASSTSSTIVDSTAPHPCDADDDERCLAEIFYNDGTLRARSIVSAHNGPSTAALALPVSVKQPSSSRWTAWPLLDPPPPLRLQVCRLLL
jgi:hypothetical protein